MLSYKSMILMIMSFMTCIIINQFSAGARDLEPPPPNITVRPYNGGLGAEPPAGSRGMQSP